MKLIDELEAKGYITKIWELTFEIPMANPFDGLTPRQHKLVGLALDFMKVMAHGGEEYDEYRQLILMLQHAIDKPLEIE